MGSIPDSGKDIRDRFKVFIVNGSAKAAARSLVCVGSGRAEVRDTNAALQANTGRHDLAVDRVRSSGREEALKEK